MVGDDLGGADEAQAEAARRELIEETGFEAGKIDMVSHGASSAGLTSEIVTLFLATELKRVGAGGGVAHENIVVYEVPLAEIVPWLEAKASAGVLVDPKVYAGLYFIKQYK
jgi:ADP-ribose pyrophosphatase